MFALAYLDELEIAVRSRYAAAVNFNLERTKCAAWGFWGGQPGTVCEVQVQSAPDSAWVSVTR